MMQGMILNGPLQEIPMRKAVVVGWFAVGIAVSGSALAQGSTMKDLPKSNTAQGATHGGTATVKKVDAGAGMVTLDHGPIASMKWPAMSMDFAVADKKMLDGLKPGAKVEFRFTEKSKGRYVITDLRQ